MPNGKPTASTWSPGARSAVERIVAASRSSGIVLARSTARSFSGCVLRTTASESEPSKNVTRIFLAPLMTCRLVRIVPLSMITTPVPTPRSTVPFSLLSLPSSPSVIRPTTRTTDGRIAS